MREFTPYQELSGIQVCDGDDIENNLSLTNTVFGVKTGIWRDGGSFTSPNNNILPDALRTTDFGFPGTGSCYYNIFMDATLFDIDVRLLNSYERYNAGSFADTNLQGSTYSYYGADNYEFIDTIHTEHRSIISTLTSESGGEINADRLLQRGRVYVKNQGSSLSLPISSALRGTLDKYAPATILEFNDKLIDFDVINDSIFLQTKTKLLIDKIQYDISGEFGKPGTSNTIFKTDSTNTINVFSNRLYVHDIKTCAGQGAVLFAIFKQHNKDLINGKPLPDNYGYIYPEIYQYDLQTNNTIKIFPQSLESDCLESFKTSYTGSVTNYAPEKIRTPKIAYNSIYNKLKISYIVLDQNNFSHIHDALFSWKNGELALERLVRYNPDHLTLRTTTFNEDTTFATVNTSSPNVKVDFNNNLLCI